MDIDEHTSSEYDLNKIEEDHIQREEYRRQLYDSLEHLIGDPDIVASIIIRVLPREEVILVRDELNNYLHL